MKFFDREKEIFAKNPTLRKRQIAFAGLSMEDM